MAFLVSYPYPNVRTSSNYLHTSPARHEPVAEYLIVVTDRQVRGHLLGHPIYRAVDFDILPLDPGVSTSKPSHPVEAHLLALVRSHLSSGHFLYSYEFDITRRLQAQFVAKENDVDKAMWETVRAPFSGCDSFLTLVSGRRQVFLE
jgi:hypothetical protein